MLARRAVLSLPFALAVPALAAGTQAVPPFPDWVGRTALLSGDGGQARLLLAADGTGMMSVRLFLFCRSLPIRAWRLAPGGTAVRYSRVSAIDSGRLIEGEAQILPAERQLLWIEARRHTADFEGFAEPEAAGRCG